MPKRKFEFADINNFESSDADMHVSRNGCYVSSLVGFALVLLAAAIAVGVGIIVHFAGSNREVICKCEPAATGGATAEAVMQQCVDMASAGNEEICLKCPTSSSTHNTITPNGSLGCGNVSTTDHPSPTSTTTTSITGQTSTPATTRPKDVRLPTSVLPIHYEVEIHLYMSGSNATNFMFKGHIKIQINCVNATNNITLHVNVLKVETQTIRFSGESGTGSVPAYTRIVEDKERQFFIIKLDKDMEAGKTYTLEMNYTSPLQSKDLNGLYLTSYNRNGQPVYMAVTQFQATDARKAFPCFDEPSFKATFDITLIRPENLISISNMPQKENATTINENGVTYVKDVYQRTPKMSTYLVAFAVSDFKYTHNTTKNGVLYRAWASPESVNHTKYSLDVGVEILTYFEEFFNISYPLPKQDMITIPDFSSGAMENWGLITYRETSMLYQEGVSSEANKERVAVIVSHELAHQWFGNLVSPAWWDDLWLNEGFASYVEFLGVDYVHPEWKMFDKFVIDQLQNALAYDGLVSSHPLYVPVSHPDEINEIFDTISYAKGASVVRMLRHFLGYDTFKKGMTRYLKGLEYGAAFHDDLWSALNQQAREDGKNIQVKAIMDTWTLQMNFPLVTVTRLFTTADTVSVSQERYLEDRDAPELGQFVSPFNYTWTIPITFTTSKNPNFNQTDRDVQWLTRFERFRTLTLGVGNFPIYNKTNNTFDPNATETDWILANVEQNGYYRVNYQLSNWRALALQLKADHQVIPVINRAQLINDVWNLAKANYLGLETAFMMIDYLDREREYVPWAAARRELAYVTRMLSNSRINETFQKFMQSKVSESYNYFGLNNTGASHNDVSARGLFASEACKYDIQACLDTARTQFQLWMSNPSNNPIDPNLRGTVYCYGIAAGGDTEWNFGLEMYKTIESASEKSNLLNALSCSKNPDTLNKYMALILAADPPIRRQDALSVIRFVASNPVGRLLAWDFFTTNFVAIKASYESALFAWISLMDGVTRALNTASELEQVKEFYTRQEGNFGTGERAIQQAIEKVTTNVNWMTKNEPIIESWLRAAGYHQTR